MHSGSHDASLQPGPAGGSQGGVPIPALGTMPATASHLERGTEGVLALVGRAFQGGSLTHQAPP